jgi:hypothetical protein
MKFKYLWTLLRLDLFANPAILLVPIAYSIMTIMLMRETHYYFFSSAGDSFMYVILFLGYQLLFQTGYIRTWNTAALLPSIGEFWFTRPVSRSTLFWHKAALFLLLIAAPGLTAWVWSHHQPKIKLKLPYTLSVQSERRESFYLQQYPGARLVGDPANGQRTRDYLILPQGQVDLARFNLFFMWFIGIVYMTVMLCTSRWTWCQRYLSLALILFMIVSPLLNVLGKLDDSYTLGFSEYGMATLAQHPFGSVLVLGVFSFLALRLARQRFCQLELT